MQYMSFRDDILITLFGGGILDYDMLDKCNYEFEDILRHIDMFTTRKDMDFNDILIGAIDEYRSNLENAIENKKIEMADNLKYLENKLDYCGYGKKELMEIEIAKEDLNKIESLYPFDDIEYNCNYLDTQIWVADDDKKAIYKEFLSKEIDEENEKIGFVELDLD